MSTTLHPALRAQIDEVMSRHERRMTTQAEIDRGGCRLPEPPYGGGLRYGGDERPLTPAEVRFALGVLAVCCVVLGLCAVAVLLWAHGQRVWR